MHLDEADLREYTDQGYIARIIFGSRDWRTRCPGNNHLKIIKIVSIKKRKCLNIFNIKFRTFKTFFYNNKLRTKLIFNLQQFCIEKWNCHRVNKSWNDATIIAPSLLPLEPNFRGAICGQIESLGLMLLKYAVDTIWDRTLPQLRTLFWTAIVYLVLHFNDDVLRDNTPSDIDPQVAHEKENPVTESVILFRISRHIYLSVTTIAVFDTHLPMFETFQKKTLRFFKAPKTCLQHVCKISENLWTNMTHFNFSILTAKMNHNIYRIISFLSIKLRLAGLKNKDFQIWWHTLRKKIFLQFGTAWIRRNWQWHPCFDKN